MTFFNKKEEVIEIQLTQYGKFLLSQGKFKPVYYDFDDDDVLYDGEYGSVIEEQNSIEGRINEVPRIKTQANFSSLQDEIRKRSMQNRGVELKKDDVEFLIPSTNIIKLNPTPMGASSPLKDEYPAWQIRYLKGELSSSTNVTSDSYQTTFIPQLNSDIKYEIKIKDLEEIGMLKDGEEENSPDVALPEIYSDGKYIEVKEKDFLLELREENVPFTKENFTVEVFLVEDGNEDNLIPLSFVKRDKEFFEDLLIQEEDLKSAVELNDTSFVDYFFDIKFDDEIEINDKEKNVKKDSIYDTGPKRDIKEEDC
jgi:hypothetical protein